MPYFYHIDRLAAEKHGVRVSAKQFYDLAGVPIRDIFAMLAEEQGVPGGPGLVDAIMASMSDLDVQQQARLVAPVGIIEPVVEIVRAEHAKGTPLAVASSGHRDAVHKHLAAHGLLDLFHAVVTVDDVPPGRGKPNPDLFLLAAERLGVPPGRCRAYEDADLGLQAVRAAGFAEAIDVRLMPGYPTGNFAEAEAEAAAPAGAF